jgi:hypothetical protein
MSESPFPRSPVYPFTPSYTPNRFASLGVIHVHLLRRCKRPALSEPGFFQDLPDYQDFSFILFIF